MNWQGWPVERIVYLYIFFVFVGLGIQIFLYHYRGNFRHVIMWGPVSLAPIIAITAGLLVLYNLPIIRTILAVLLVIILLVGLVGFTLHVRGVNLRVGGLQMNNILTGPPIVLPLTLVGNGLLGLAVLYWQVIFK
ncbi:MAG: hypothetical protein APF76_06870 [Desulfitibacter sp. BRH_c19]|nr:MAG: hypothetical protein APF76_06870 [Desulfitibacter sp. BRH_c19]